jgi:hypothetical protein
MWEDPRARDSTAQCSDVGPQVGTTKEGGMQGLAIVMALLFVLATTLAFGVAVV